MTKSSLSKEDNRESIDASLLKLNSFLAKPAGRFVIESDIDYLIFIIGG